MLVRQLATQTGGLYSSLYADNTNDVMTEYHTEESGSAKPAESQLSSCSDTHLLQRTFAGTNYTTRNNCKDYCSSVSVHGTPTYIPFKCQ